MASSTVTGWAQLRQQARSLETQVDRFKMHRKETIYVPMLIEARTQTDTLFHTFSQFASMTQLPPKPSEEERRIESQLEDILSRVRIKTIISF
jgi:Golgi SNAP receptor complex protein 1